MGAVVAVEVSVQPCLCHVVTAVGDSPSPIPKMVIVPGSSVMATRSSNMQKGHISNF